MIHSIRRWKVWGVLLLTGVLWSDSFQAGGVFLLIFPGAKATAMGGAFSAVGDDATAAYYNPGAIAFFDHLEASLIHAQWLPSLAPDMSYDFLGLVYPLQNNAGVAGVHIIYLNLGQIDYREINASWRPFDVAVNLTYAFPFTPELGVGVTGKFIYSFLAPVDVLRAILQQTNVNGGSASSFAFDVGMLYQAFPWLRLSTTLANLGFDLKYTSIGAGDPLPWTLRVGAAYKVWKDEYYDITVAADLHKVIVGITNDLRQYGIDTVWDDTWRSVGLDLTYYDFVSLRIGYFQDVTGARSGVTFGGGVKLKNFKIDIADDSRIYAYGESNNRRLQVTYMRKF